MKTIHFDSIGGASGDMILACLIGLGADVDSLRRQLASLNIGTFGLDVENITANGLAAVRVEVSVPDSEHHPHRHLNDIRGLIDGSDLPPEVKTMSKAMFERLAEAEAAVHGTTPDEVHFHEVGAVDSIVDMVGTCIAIHELGVENVTAGPLPLGRGSTETAHGALPVPVPATVELLRGMAVTQTDEPFELVTPTAAALLSTWVTAGAPDQVGKRPGPEAPLHLATSDGRGGRRPLDGVETILASATACGHHTLHNRANILRARLSEWVPGLPGPSHSNPPMEGETPSSRSHDTCLVLECNLDDTVPELLGSLIARLLEHGALDVFTTAVQMKKQRPGSLLTVLCRPDDRDALVDIVFAETTTFGIREYVTHRTMLDRRHVTVGTPYGDVRIKIGTWKGRDITRAPEHGDCLQRASEHGVPVRTVYEAACAAGQLV